LTSKAQSSPFGSGLLEASIGAMNRGSSSRPGILFTDEVSVLRAGRETPPTAKGLGIRAASGL
jgi:hypothetical protein